MNCRHIKKGAQEIAESVGRIHMRKFQKKLNIRWKAATDPVTEVDIASEKFIAKEIKKRFPGHAMVGEEGEGFGDPNSQFVWYCDPLDGTVNYSHGIPIFNVSLGVYWKGKPLIGVVHAAALRETYVAEKGHGAWLNGKRIRVSHQKSPLAALTVSGFAYQARTSGQNVREWSNVLKDFQAIRRLGSAAIDLCWVAAGRFDAFWEYGLKPWDMAAGGLIVTEAGGKVSRMDGTLFQLQQQDIMASNGKLHAALSKTLRKAWKQKLVWPPK